MLMKDDEFNLDGTVEVAVDCRLKMSRLDYMVMMSLHQMNEVEKESLLLNSIPKITKQRVVPDQSEINNLRKHKYRLKNIRVYA